MRITSRPAITVSERNIEAMLAGLPDARPGLGALRDDCGRARGGQQAAWPAPEGRPAGARIVALARQAARPGDAMR